VELHWCANRSDVHGFAVVGDAGWDAYGDDDGGVNNDRACNIAAVRIATSCTAATSMVDAGGVLSLGRGLVGLVFPGARIAPAAWASSSSWTDSCLPLGLFLRRRLRGAAAGIPDAVLDSGQPHQCQWGNVIHRNGDAQRACSKRRSRRLPLQQRAGSDGSG
jgi:hypothetical protein